MISTCYQVSMMREEDRPVTLRLILADPGGAIELNHLFPLHSEPDHTGLDGQGNLQADNHASRTALYEQMLASGLDFDGLERGLLDHAVRKADGNLSRAARMLGMTRPQLAYRLKKTLSQPASVANASTSTIGTKITAATSMTLRVFCDEVASQMVRLCAGFRLDGMMKGNMAKPAVHRVPVMARLEPRKAQAPRLPLAAARARVPPRMPVSGASLVSGYCA